MFLLRKYGKKVPYVSYRLHSDIPDVVNSYASFLRELNADLAKAQTELKFDLMKAQVEQEERLSKTQEDLSADRKEFKEYLRADRKEFKEYLRADRKEFKEYLRAESKEMREDFLKNVNNALTSTAIWIVLSSASILSGILVGFASYGYYPAFNKRIEGE
jgi:hypothetical protein